MVKLQSGEATQDVHEGCRRWRMQRPEHEQAWLQLESLNRRIQSLPGALAHTTFDDAAMRRRQFNRRMALKSIGLMVGVGTLAIAGRQVLPWQRMLADHSTDVGQRKRIMLADGTSIHLNTDTALDIAFDDRQRLIILRRGEVLITTGHDTASHDRPFVVETAEGRSRALGTRFMVRQESTATLVSVFESAVEVRPGQVVRPIRVDAGQQVRFSGSKAGTLEPANPDAAAWTEGAIVARQMRLDMFTHELSRYRLGRLVCDPAVAHLKISGVFPLDDTNRILGALESTLPIKVERYTDYWLTLVDAGSGARTE